MKLIVLDGYALNPGDLSYECLNQFGDVTIYDRTDSEAEAISRIGEAEIVSTRFPLPSLSWPPAQTSA